MLEADPGRDTSPQDEAERRSRIKHDLLQALAATDSLEEGVRLSLEAAIAAGGMDSGGFYLLERATSDLVLKVQRGLGPAFLAVTARLGSGTPEGRLVASGGALYVEQEQLAADRAPSVVREGLRSYCAIPLLHRGEVLGCLNVASHSRGTIAPPVRLALETIAAAAGQAIARLRAQEDLHERDAERQAESEALARRDEIFSKIVEGAADSIVVIDSATLRFVEFNTAAHRDLGYTREEFARLGVGDIQAEHSAAEIRANTDGLRQRGAIDFSTKHRRKDGSLQDAEVRLRHLDLLGRDYLAAVWTDVSERKRLEEDLRQTQKLEAVGQLAGGIAHDFNNVLAAIQLHVGMLQDRDDLDEETQQSLASVARASERAAGLTRQLLMFSRRSVLALKPLDLDGVIGEMLRMLGRVISEDIELRFEPRGALPAVQADAGMVEQVLMNLVVNARDAMPGGGRLTIATDVVDRSSDEAGAAGPKAPPAGDLHPPGRYVRLTVADTGCGMDAATVARVFEPFFTTKEPGKGTGLGLATVHGIVAQHRGWVDVESGVGRGSAFRVYLPALEATAVPLTVEPPSRPARGRLEAVLVVEDEAGVRGVVSRTLRQLGYRVLEAASGQEALGVFQRSQGAIDLLLTDMVMPAGMSGLELARALRARSPRLKVVIVSGYSEEVVASGAPGGGITYLPKPFTPSVLAEAVRRTLDEEQPAAP